MNEDDLPLPKLTMDQQVLAYMVITMARYYDEAMQGAGLSEEKIQEVVENVTARMEMDMQTGNMIGMPESE